MLRDSGSIPGSGRSPGIGNATHSSILAWRISWTEETGGLQSMGSQRVRHGLKWLSTAQHKTTSITSQFLQHKVWTEISLIPWNHQTSWMLFFFLLCIHICTTPVMPSCFLLYSSDVFLCIFLQELGKKLQKLCVSLMHFNSTYLTALQTKVTLPFLLILILMIIPCESEAIPSYVHLSQMLN